MPELLAATRKKIRTLLEERAAIEAERAALLATIDEPLAKLSKRLGVITTKIEAAAPWSADMPEDQREHAFVRFDGLGTLRRVWVKPKKSVNIARLLQHVDKTVIDECSDETPGSSRVQFYPERTEAL